MAFPEASHADRQQPEPLSLFWPLQIGGWLLMLVSTFLVMWELEGDWRSPIIIATIRQTFGFTVTLGLRRVYHRWPAGQQLFRLLLRASIFPPLCAAIDVAVTYPLLARLGAHSMLALVRDVVGLWFLRVGVYMSWTVLYFWLRQLRESQQSELRMARLEAAAREGELASLRAQINPHFLFNALNSILAEIEDSSPKARALTEALADYLRFSLRQRDQLLPLGLELDAMASYLEVEQSRFEENFRYHLVAAEETRTVLVPPSLLQPLIENAIKYGMKTSRSPLILRVGANLEDGWLNLCVENTGAWVRDGDGIQGSRIGLANLRRRLDLLFHGKATLETDAIDGMVRVRVRIPATQNQAAQRKAANGD